LNPLGALLDKLRERRVELWVEGDRLRYRAPAGALTPVLLAELKNRRSDVVAYFRSVDHIIRAPDQAYYEVSHAQRRIWVQSQLSSATYNIPLSLVLDGHLDRDALGTALTQLLARHEILRTTFIAINGEPRQVVRSTEVLPLKEIDFSNENDGDSRAWALAESEARQLFDLEQGPLFRVCLVHLGPQRHLLHFTIHHIVGDGWSFRVLISDLMLLYKAATTGTAPDLAQLNIQYRDFAAWQNRALTSGNLEAQRQYWLTRLSGSLPVLNLPLDSTRPRLQTFNGEGYCLRFDDDEIQLLRSYARSHSSTVFTILVALVKVLLYRYTGQTDVIVGTAVAGRSRPELDNQIGCYINTLVLRDDLNPCASFDSLFQQVRQSLLGALDHQDYPFDCLLEELRLGRDLSRSPLFDVMMVSQTDDGLQGKMGPVKITHLPHVSRTSKCDLTFNCEENCIQIGIEYNPDLFTRDRIARMGQHLRTLLRGSLQESIVPLHSLPILAESERTILVESLSQTTIAFEQATVIDLIANTAHKFPNRTAVVCGDRTLTFREVELRALEIAQYLVAKGVVRGDTVGVLLKRSSDLVAVLLGVLQSGAAYLPLDPLQPQERLIATLTDSGARFTLCDHNSHDLLSGGAFPILCIDSETLEHPDISAVVSPHTIPTVSLDDLAYVIYTSGSTGRPKGVEISHGALSNFLRSMEREPGLTEKDVILAVTTICFDIAALELFLPLCVGAKLVIASNEALVDAEQLSQLTSGATVLQATPATWRMLIAAGWKGSPDLRVFCGGEALPVELSEQLLIRCKEAWNLYGPTETTIWSAIRRIQRRFPGETSGSATEPIGHPVANTGLYVFDKWLSPVPVGVTGELYIGGGGVSYGYRNRPDLTAEKFLPDPFSKVPGARMYRTGDLVRPTIERTYEFLGRSDYQIKIRGFRVELGEIEAFLRAHAEIAEAVVIARPGADGTPVLTAYLESRGECDSVKIRRYLAAQLPGYMVPSSFICLPNLPVNSNGKIDRLALSCRATLSEQIVVSELPKTFIESQLTRIWRETLGTESIGIHNNFFELGGHSLHATKIIALLKLEFGAQVTLRDFFTRATIAELAAFIEKGGVNHEKRFASDPCPIKRAAPLVNG
jgi:amino acid adenylation domain-containing protein